MKAVVFQRYGGPEVLELRDVPRPNPKAGELLIKVRAVSINRMFDIDLRRDGAGMGITLPFTPGVDPVGEVVEIGPGVDNFTVGQRVATILPRWTGGGDAEFVATAAKSTWAIPDGLTFAEGCVVARHFPIAFGLCRVAALRAGEWALIMGAAGALGSCLVQVAKQLGAKVIAGAGSDARAAATRELGADLAINYRKQDLTEVVLGATGGKGVDVALDNLGDAELWRSMHAVLGDGGRIATVGFHGGNTIVPLDIARLITKRHSIRSGIGSQTYEDGVNALAMAASGRLRVLIDRILPMRDVRQAHELVEGNQALGKVLLDPTQA